MAKNRKKYVLTCTAPNELTRYNNEWNKQLEEGCRQNPIFEPKLNCEGCIYLDVKGYK